MPVIQNLLTPREAADVIGCTVGRIYQLLQEDRLEGVKIHQRAWLIPEPEVRRFASVQQTRGRPRISERTAGD